MENWRRSNLLLAYFTALCLLMTLFTGQEVRAESPDYGNSCGTAKPISLNSSLAGTLSPAGDLDFFRFTMPEAGILTVNTTGTTDTYGELYDSTGALLGGNDDSNGYNFNIAKLLGAGTYCVKVRHYSSSGTGSYTFSNIVDPIGPDDHGDSCSAATSVSLNSNKAGVINYNGDKDFFRVTVPSMGQLTVYTDGSIDTYGSLYDASCNLLQSNDDGIGGYSNYNFLIKKVVTAGTYYVSTRHYSSGVGRYTFVNQFIPDDHGNTSSTATVKDRNSSTAGAINYAGDVDYFSIRVPWNGTLKVYTTGSTNTYGKLFKDNGTTSPPLMAENDNISSSDLNFSITIGVDKSTTYYVAVQHASSASTSGSYTLVSEWVPCDDCDDYPNTREKATAISSWVPGRIDYPGDVDWMRIQTIPFSADSGRENVLTVFTTGNTDTFGCLYLPYNPYPRPNPICNDNDDTGSLNLRLSGDAPIGGYYDVMVSHSSRGTGDYTLAWLHGDDHGDSKSMATPFSPNSSMAGTTNFTGDVDYFKINVQQSGTLTVQTTGTTDTYGELYNASEDLIARYSHMRL